MESRLSDLTQDLEDNGGRADIMSIHMKNVKQELSHTQVRDSKKSHHARESMMPNVAK